ncbi:tetratricopeptide repeat protein [Aestuariivirga sp.]|uniref:tetratricopeptide repeat protein n=1 Tax=Aestuariivirga sp. TaxID=2650926 RepID=UPI0039E551AD
MTLGVEATDDEKRDAVARIVASGALGRLSKLPAILTYLVEQELAGKGEALKGYAIATDVLGRGTDFDPGTDSIVRVELRRLRQALALYYATDGAADPVRITIPSGTYRPSFERREGGASVAGQEESATPRAPAAAPVRGEAVEVSPMARTAGTVVSLLIAAALGLLLWFSLTPLFQNVQAPAPIAPVDDIGRIKVVLEQITASRNEPLLAEVSQGLHRQLLAEMGSVRFMQVTGASPDTASPPAKGSIHIRVHLQHSPDRVRMIVDLLSPSGVELWGNVYNVQWETALGLQDDLAQRLLTDLRGQVLTASRRLSQKISRSKAATSVWQSYIQATWVPSNQPLSLAWEKERIALAEKAITDDPRFGPAHAILAQKLAMLELVSAEYRTPAMRERAAMHALKAMELGGDDPDAMFHVAVYDWSVGKLNDAEAAFRRVLELEPSHFLAGALAPAVSLGCQVAPDSAIDALEERDRRLTPDNPYRWVLLSFIGTLQANAGHWDKAEAALRTAYFQHVGPETFIPLAAVLGQRGDSLEAVVHMRMQAANWPGIDMDYIASEFMTKRCSGKELPLNEAFLGLAKLLKSSPL